jgi:hypothetical protein
LPEGTFCNPGPNAIEYTVQTYSHENKYCQTTQDKLLEHNFEFASELLGAIGRDGTGVIDIDTPRKHVARKGKGESFILRLKGATLWRACKVWTQTRHTPFAYPFQAGNTPQYRWQSHVQYCGSTTARWIVQRTEPGLRA